MAKRTAKEFNEDPKHEQERTEFDQLVEGSFNRIAERKKKEQEKNGGSGEKSFFDEMLEGIFGGK